MTRFSLSIMGADAECDFASKIHYEACGLDDNSKLTKEIFEKNLDKVMEVVREYTKYKFHVAFKVLGRFVLLFGVAIPDKIRSLIVEATDWYYEDVDWNDQDEEKRRDILRDLREKIENYTPGIPNPINEDKYYEY